MVPAQGCGAASGAGYEPAERASASPTSAETSSSRAAASSKAMRGLPGRSYPCPVSDASLVQEVAIAVAAPGTSRPTRRICATSWVTVSWRATASSRIVESTARRRLPARAPVPPITSRTASKIRWGRSEVARRRRQYVSVEGWKPVASTAKPQGLPAQVEGQCLHRLPVGQPVEGLQHQDARDHVPWDRGTCASRREQVGERAVGEQVVPVPREEREHAAQGQQVSRDRPHIQQTQLAVITSLHGPESRPVS